MCSWHWFLLICLPQDSFFMRLSLVPYCISGCLHRFQFFSRACLHACDWLCMFPALATGYIFSRASDWLYMFPALFTGYIFPALVSALATECRCFPRLSQVTFFPRLCPRLQLNVDVSRACHRLHFFPRFRLTVHVSRACHSLHFSHACLRACDWLYIFPALVMIGYIFHGNHFPRFKHFVLSHRVFCANRSF